MMKSLVIAEIITLRAIALKLSSSVCMINFELRRDHNATSYSTETKATSPLLVLSLAEIITLRAIALKLVSRSPSSSMVTAEIITLRAIALKLFVYDDVQDYELDTQRS